MAPTPRFTPSIRRPAFRRAAGLLLLALIALLFAAGAATPAAARFPSPDVSTSNLLSRRYLPTVMHYAPTEIVSSAEWLLVADDLRIERHTVERVVHPFTKHPANPLLVADQKWEGQIVQLYGTVLPGFRMWYSSYNAFKKTNKALYAESDNGLVWTKPPIDEDGKNLIVGDSVLISMVHRPDDTAQPYKMMVNADDSFYGFWSPDGIQITGYPENPLLSIGSDVAQFYWDPATGFYRGSAKQSVDVRGVRRRAVRFAQSLDFVHWELLPGVFAPDRLDDQLYPDFYTHFYGLSIFPAGAQYLGFLWIFNARDDAGRNGPVHTELVSSIDGVNWQRAPGDRPAILELGPPGAWDSGQIYTAISPIVVGDEYWLYYSGCNLEHGAPLLDLVCSIGLATAPYNRLVSLRGDGEIVTGHLHAPDRRLRLNYAAGQGEIRVELLQGGQPVPGYEAAASRPLSGDSQDEAVVWKTRTTLPDDPFQIKFYLQDSALFAYKTD